MMMMVMHVDMMKDMKIILIYIFLGYDEGYEDYPYLYFPSVLSGLKNFDTNKTLSAVCVKTCPNDKNTEIVDGKLELECKTTSMQTDCSISEKDYYESKPLLERICFPKSNDDISYDPLKQKLVEIYDPDTGDKFKKVINNEDIRTGEFILLQMQLMVQMILKKPQPD